MTWLAGAKGSQPEQISGIYCNKCKRFTCIGCRGKPRLGKISYCALDAVVNNCCPHGRLFGSWLLLCRFDEVELQHKAAEDLQRRGPKAPLDNGTGYTPESEATASRVLFKDSNINYSQQNDLTDMVMTEVLLLLTAFLPVNGLGSSFDREPPAEFFALFRLSLLFDRVTMLLRNDSISDMARRSDLYQAALAFVTAMAKHPRLVHILTDKRPEKKRSPGLKSLGENFDSHALVVDISPSGLAGSLLTYCHNTFKQADAFACLSHNAAMAKGIHSDDSKQTIAIFKSIVGFRDAVKQTAPDAIQDPAKTPKDPWQEFTEAKQVTFTDDVLVNHRLSHEWCKIQSPPPGRMTGLWKEIASWTTSLPPGIFVKVSDSRPDVMKILIIGVPGSPYAGGLFIFDMYLPHNWPAVPPQMYFAMNQGCGLIRFSLNPNIHEDGTVCLSLLNTWHGSPAERWLPHRSTLLSVFVSIQAMILGVANPAENEPLRSSLDPDPQQIVKYVQAKTVYYAMLYWLTAENVSKNIWRDIIQMYWICKGKEVLATVREWSKTNKLISSWNTKSDVINFRCWNRTAEGVNLLEMLEKSLWSSSGSRRVEQPTPRYRY
ncbi:uncharacterized protein BP5553_02641 [Venustampulla echinocandica]|uniref:UBC core domain-containing protein n=1 Tax=Venustampulla echinocandica TaxID=2656787 RepID=A0A370TS08_9HELO|nr:uncharacterized protein BP5553_02641 [Venustampulla echinocandica]RDL38301.1 hypothetical protein BP5553_02641 [Venustampulla echinocandica]